MKKAPSQRFICFSVELDRIIWSASQSSYYKGDYKGEMLFAEICEVHRSTPSEMVTNFGANTFFGHKSIDANCVSLVGSKKKSLFLEGKFYLTSRLFSEACQWLLRNKPAVDLAQNNASSPPADDSGKHIISSHATTS